MSEPTLTSFLLARIAEDEAAQGDGKLSWEHWHTGQCGEVGAASGMNYCDCDARVRVLAECQAKRRIVELHDGSHECSTYDHNGDVDNCTWCLDASDCSTLRLLAAVYSDHEAYREEWRA